MPQNINNQISNFIFLYYIIMKKFRLLTLLWVALLAWTLAWCWNNTNTNLDTQWGDLIIEDTTAIHDAVVEYNDWLVELARECIVSEENIPTDYESWLEGIQNAVNNTIAQCQNSIAKINEMWDWEWDSSLKDWVINVLELDIAYFTKFNEVLPYLLSEELTEEDANKYETLVEEINAIDQELDAANNNMVNIQSEFAQNHWFQLEEPAEE